MGRLIFAVLLAVIECKDGFRRSHTSMECNVCRDCVARCVVSASQRSKDSDIGKVGPWGRVPGGASSKAPSKNTPQIPGSTRRINKIEPFLRGEESMNEAQKHLEGTSIR
ncbi:hypothetical protein DFH08DRAFT_450760 [Mycena albidolilacea]|uniref:Secreted protein n=1 Tax=Mycena albidolilacea TaxID=1033008 RepID=A0AAD7ECN1_9AGAR|nr:hypothetical protein DFH08DRAFT_450760 [Mycena albidolilacea]